MTDRYRSCFTPLSSALAFALLTLMPHMADAQTVVNPTTAEFDPSPDHNATSNGTPIVNQYQLGLYNIGAAQPFQLVPLGKPNPAGDGKIRVVLTGLLGSLPLSGVNYEAKVSAVGPGGVTTSAASNLFSFTAPCSFSISPTVQPMTSAGGNATATVTTTNGCAWTATESSSWISITAGSSGNTSGTVTYSVSQHTGTSPRSASLTIAGQTLTVNQSGACSYSISPTTQPMTSAGGTATATVTTTSGCAWTATESSSWLSITGGSSGNTSGTVSYSVSQHTGTSPRSASLTIAGQPLTVNQSGSCSYTVSPMNPSATASGGAASLSVTTTSTCAWTATSGANWLTISNGANRTGNGTLNYTAAANTGALRTGSMNVAGKTVTVTQSAAGSPGAPTNLRIVTN